MLHHGGLVRPPGLECPNGRGAARCETAPMDMTATVANRDGVLFVVEASPARRVDPGAGPLNLGLDMVTAIWRLLSGRRQWRVTVRRWPADRERPKLHELVPTESIARSRFSELVKQIEDSP